MIAYPCRECSWGGLQLRLKPQPHWQCPKCGTIQQEEKVQTPKSIFDQIMEYKSGFIGATGKKPEYLYFGRNELEALVQEVKAKGHSVNPDLEGKRPTIAGLKLFIVNADNHFSIS